MDVMCNLGKTPYEWGFVGAGAYVAPAGAGIDMTLRLDEPAFVLDSGLVPHRANTILDSGALLA